MARSRAISASNSRPRRIARFVIQDQSRYIYEALHEINIHLWAGSALASLVVLAFMRNWRTTVIAAIAIPASVVSTFGMMWALHFTLNSVTMLALVVPLAMYDPDHGPLYGWTGYLVRWVPVVTVIGAILFAAQMAWHVRTVRRRTDFRFVDNRQEPCASCCLPETESSGSSGSSGDVRSWCSS